MKCLGCILLLTWSLCHGLSAQSTIWVAHLKATFQEATRDPRILLLQPRLKSVFGYPQYVLLGEARVSTSEKYAQWVVPQKLYYFKIEPLPHPDNQPTPVQFELYRTETLIMQGRFLCTQPKPIFINGPDFNDGRLIFILQVAPPSHPHR